VITLDLTKTNEMWITLENLIVYLKKRVKECIKEANKQHNGIKEKIVKKIQERMNNNVVSIDKRP
jgi:DNA relaxase NicK